jgi:outer membrane immunogenic protein
MDKLNQLLVSSPAEFAAAFDAIGDDSRAEPARASAAFWLEGGITCAGSGFVWGNGEINYQGRNYAFRLSGLSIADIGAASVCANGSVMHLRRLSDFSGSYSASLSERAAAGSDPVTFLKNERGVVMKLTATDAAWRINLQVNGLRVRLKQPK